MFNKSCIEELDCSVCREYAVRVLTFLRHFFSIIGTGLSSPLQALLLRERTLPLKVKCFTKAELVSAIRADTNSSAPDRNVAKADHAKALLFGAKSER
jgi:hypothetical protein